MFLYSPPARTLRRMRLHLLLKHTLGILFLASVAVRPGLATQTFIQDPGAGTGSERCVSSGSGAADGGVCAAGGVYSGLESMIQLFADSEGLTLTRVDDSSDEIWTTGTGAGIFGLARSASRDFTLGILPGETDETYTSVLPVIGSAGSVEYLPSADVPASGTGQNINGDLQSSATYDSNGLPIFTSIAAGTFRFGIQCAITSCSAPLQTWSSLPTDNSDGADHMVTWALTGAAIPNGDTWYIAGFENGTDFDFNDYVFLFQNVTPSGVAPEPGSAIFIACGILAILAVKLCGAGRGPIASALPSLFRRKRIVLQITQYPTRRN